MKTYFIVRHLVPPYKHHRYLKDGTQYDYLGQILLQMGYTIPDGCRFPQELGEVISPFTFPCRGSVHDTTLTTEIMQLDITDKADHPRKLAELLKPYSIEIEWKR